MKTNSCTFIHCEKVILIPYQKQHVEKYHEWMSSEELQELTASEPLTLEQEYEMQHSWLIDDNKCTFIILDASKFKETQQEIESMIGDVNLFFNDDTDNTTAEIEIMIAESSCRGKGMGKEALMTMMSYGVNELRLKTITAKIGYKNTPSQQLFKKIGFQEVSKSDVFEEITYELPVTEKVKETLPKLAMRSSL